MLYSQTGGGHRAAARAIEAALPLVTGDTTVDLRDGLVEGGPWPMNRSPELYAWSMSRARWTYALPWHLTNGPLRARLMADLSYPSQKRRLRRIVEDSNPDIIVSVHPLLTRSIVRVISSLDRKPPFVVVVTDLVTGHWTWFDRGVDLTLVPTQECLDRVVRGGMDPTRMAVTGQVVHPLCATALDRRHELRKRFGWEGPVVLMLAGGDGVGRLDLHLESVTRAHLPARIVVVCGRNAQLLESFHTRNWQVPVELHGFVNNLHELMAAADILVTKGGPGSVMEGCAAGLPILIYDRLPGQEIGNVQFVEQKGIGHYVPKPADLTKALQHWLTHPDELAAAAAAAKAAGNPHSARDIARRIVEI